MGLVDDKMLSNQEYLLGKLSWSEDGSGALTGHGLCGCV